MGRATITGGGTDGLYTATLDYGSAERDAIVAELTARNVEIAAQIVSLETIDDNHETTISDLLVAESVAISDYNASGKAAEEKAALLDITERLVLARNSRRFYNQDRARLVVEQAQNTARIAFLNTQVLTESRSIWCADYTELGTGLVGTIEVNGNKDSTIIAPGASAAGTDDGEMSHIAVMSSAQLYFNLALLPAWQKNMPTYRVGTITVLDTVANTCSVDLDAALSSEQALNINQASSLSAVPVVYMSCHAAAFAVDDRVIIQFTGQDWTGPKVIGFESNPAPCFAKRIYAVANLDWDNRDFTAGGDPVFGNLYLGGTYSVTSTFPTNGENLYVEDYDGDYFGASPSYNNYLPFAIGRINILLDFTNSWSQDTGTAETYSRKTGGYTLQVEGTTISLAPSTPTIDSISPDATSITTTHYDTTIGADVTLFPDTPDELDYHTAAVVKTRDIYNFLTETEGPVMQDRDHANTWILARYASPPASIMVDISGFWVEYVFESIGPRPDQFNDWTPVGTDPVRSWGVIYRQADYLE